MTGKLCVFSRIVNLVNSAQNPARNLLSCRGPSGAASLANRSAGSAARSGRRSEVRVTRNLPRTQKNVHSHLN